MSESNCCGAKVIHSDICAKCKEHCDEIEVYCTNCDWEGKENDLEFDGEFTQEDGMIGYVYCPKCGKETIEDI